MCYISIFVDLLELGAAPSPSSPFFSEPAGSTPTPAFPCRSGSRFGQGCCFCRSPPPAPLSLPEGWAAGWEGACQRVLFHF